MATSNKEQIPTYSLDAAKKNAATGWTGDLSRYGIDYSQEQRDAIANIFRDQATAAYGSAQNQFSNSMAQQQSSLQDSIRRSSAQAVATGASRGMQAANELSSMLGLQQAAAQEASAMQGTYAEALANAQQKAYEVQNAANQVGAQMYAADSASEAQKYAANMDAYINDPYRAFSEAAALKATGDPQQSALADALLSSFYVGMGLDPATAQSYVDESNKQYNADGTVKTTRVDWAPGKTEGTLNGTLGGVGANQVNYKDLKNGKNESFRFVDETGTAFSLKATGASITSTNNSTLYSKLGQLSGNPKATNGSIVYYDGSAYISAGGVWRKITSSGGLLTAGPSSGLQGLGYNEFMRKFKK